MKLQWIENLRKRTLGRALPKGRHNFGLTDHVEVQVTKDNDGYDTVYRYELIIGCDLRLSAQHDHDPLAHEGLKERAVFMLARHLYKQQIDALYDLRDQMWEDGVPDTDESMRKLSEVLDGMTAK